MNSKKPNELRGVLRCISGDDSNQIVKLRRDATIFGREKGDIVLRDAEVSSTHCQIQNIDNEYHIFDMNSSNGTFVNDEKILKAKLLEGDTIRMGSTQFTFSMEDAAKVRHIPTLFKTANSSSHDRSNSLVETIIERELRTFNEHAIRIEVTYGTNESEVITLSQKVVYIGRASSFGAFDQDAEMSRKHLLIKLNETGEVFVEDQGSTNGSFLNGNRITGMHLVQQNDELKVGLCLMKISAVRK